MSDLLNTIEEQKAGRRMAEIVSLKLPEVLEQQAKEIAALIQYRLESVFVE